MRRKRSERGRRIMEMYGREGGREKWRGKGGSGEARARDGEDICMRELQLRKVNVCKRLWGDDEGFVVKEKGGRGRGGGGGGRGKT